MTGTPDGLRAAMERPLDDLRAILVEHEVAPAEPDAGDVETLTDEERRDLMRSDWADREAVVRRIIATRVAEVRRVAGEQIAQALEVEASRSSYRDHDEVTEAAYLDAARVARQAASR